MCCHCDKRRCCGFKVALACLHTVAALCIHVAWLQAMPSLSTKVRCNEAGMRRKTSSGLTQQCCCEVEDQKGFLSVAHRQGAWVSFPALEGLTVTLE